MDLLEPASNKASAPARVAGDNEVTRQRKCDYCQLGYRRVVLREVAKGSLSLIGGMAMAAYSFSLWSSIVQVNEPRGADLIVDGILPGASLGAVTFGYAKISQIGSELVCKCNKRR